MILRKGIYDKVAAKLILQRYLDFHNSEEDKLVVPKVAQKNVSMERLREDQGLMLPDGLKNKF